MCDRSGCTRPGTLRPVQLVAHKSAPTAVVRAQLSLRVCEECSRVLGVDDFLTDEGWRAMSDAFARSGKKRPTRELTKHEFIRLDSEEAKQGERDYGFAKRGPN